MNKNNLLVLLAVVVAISGCGGSDQTTTKASFRAIANAIAVQSIPTFDKSRGSYTITKNTDGSYSVRSVSDGSTVSVAADTTSIKFSDMTVNLTAASTVRAIAPADLQSIIELYIAYFNRIPDADGLEYWARQFNAGQTIDQIGTSFYNAAVQFSDLTGYAAGMGNADFVTKIYQNVLGRTPDSDGLTYWTNSLNSGTATRGTLVKTMLASAHTFKGDSSYGWVADLLDNKVTVANYYAVQQGLNYNTSTDSITKTMAITAAVSATNTSAALNLIGSSDTAFNQVSATPSAFAPVVNDPTFLNFYTLKTDAGPTFVDGDYTLPTSYEWTDNNYAMADFRGLGRNDLVIAGIQYSNNYQDPATWKKTSMRVLANAGTGTFMDGASQLFPSGAPAAYLTRQIIIRDFNRDGIPDMFLTNSGVDLNPWPGEASGVWLSNNGQRTFANSAQWFGDADVIGMGHTVTSGDIERNGIESVYVGNICCGTGATPYFAINDGKGNFTKDRTRLPASVIQANSDSLGTHAIRGYTSSLLLDVNGDGFPDLILGAMEPSSPFVPTTNKVFLNDGTGHFTDAKAINLPKGCFLNADGTDNSQTVAMSSMDVNGDGMLDLILSQTTYNPFYQGRCIQVLVNDGTGHFTDETKARIDSAFDLTQRWVMWPLPIDLNGDGFKDLVLQQTGFGTSGGGGLQGNQATVLMNDGTGRFKPVSRNFFPQFKGLNGQLQPIDLYGDGRISYVQSYSDFVGKNRVTKFAIYELKNGVKLPVSY